MPSNCPDWRTMQPDDRTLQLGDGRTLGYRIFGDPNGRPLFFFHGTPGSRFCLSSSDLIAKVSGLRLILPERPGYGISTKQPKRKFADWASDVIELADQLGLGSFSVSGSSGGGPYALACGALQPERVTRILLFNSAAPLDGADARKGMSFGNKLGLVTANYAPWVLKLLIKLAASSMQKSPDANLDALEKQLPPVDVRWMKDPHFRAVIKRDMLEAYAHGISGHCSDALLIQRRWDIELCSIQQPVHLWHGELDSLSPIQNVKRMAGLLPNCQTRFLADAGHFLIDLPEVVDDVKLLVEML